MALSHLWLCSVALAAADTSQYAPQRTSWGTPDLQGVWDFRTLTPLERPLEFGDKAVLTPAEAKLLLDKALGALGENRSDNSALDVEGAYNAFWLDPGHSLDARMRTSLIVDPPHGRLPEMRADARANMLSQNRERKPPVRDVLSYSVGPDYLHQHPESLGLSERCLVGFNAGPPITPSGYNNNLRIVQTPEYVLIVTEMIHDARIIPTNGQPHLPAQLRQWSGSSIGYWEDNTLVVETTNFTDKTPGFQLPIQITNPDASGAVGSARNIRLIERFHLIDDQQLSYQFTLDEPESFTQSFTVQVTMQASNAKMFEYACHEGNYAMGGILRGARLFESEAKPHTAGNP